jgi:DNA-directed RNA polymerase|tara:strand:- start:11776 stop:14301 length:2526 start_codon:yes stop_codon:yes gene_type:complete
MTMLDRQLKLELDANDYSYTRLMNEVRSRVNSGQADELAEGKLILVHSIDILADKIVDYFEKDIRGKMKAARDIVAIEFYETPKDLAYIIIATIVRSISRDVHVPTISLVKQINKSLYDSILVRRLDRDDSTFGAFVDKRFKSRSEAFRRREKLKIVSRQETLNDPELNDVTTYLAGMLLDLVIKSGSNIIEKKIVYAKGKRTQYIVYTEECFRMVLQSRDRLLADYRKFPILLVKPVEWASFDGSGGYHTPTIYQLPIIKCRAGSKKLLQSYFSKTDTTPIYDLLNTMQGTRWQINKNVYNTMNKVFRDNIVDPEALKNNPYLLGKLPYNEKKDPEDFINIHNYGDINTTGNYKGLPKEKTMMRKYFKDIEAQKDLIMSNTGKAIMLDLVLFNAREYLDEEEFFFSYQYDFRGRVYPVQQHLQPQGGSEVKSLLQFTNGYPIKTEEELRWFLIHGANCYGFDKELYNVRIDKIKAKTDEIKEIAANPIQSQRYWKDAEDPYLYLAWCFEYSAYLDDPTGFRSHIPIALDATCSGIQIYSGLLRDRAGAEAVNVIGKGRNDIYGRVAKKGNEYLSTGDYPKTLTYTTSDKQLHEVPTQAIADSLKGKINRQLTKRNTMTQPYSVTRFGMYEQLKGELTDMENNNKKFWVGETWLVAKLLTGINDRAIADVVKGARVGQEYLKEVTQDVVRGGRWVFFTTPLTKFPVLQKIHKTKVERITTPIGKLSIRKAVKEMNPTKMVNGIAPNFIHSLDATLLAQTVLKLKEDGCTDFHLIHDSYGVPVTHVANLNKRVREAYIELFKCEPLQQFVNQVRPEYEKTVDSVMINTLDLDEVAKSEYIFS